MAIERNIHFHTLTIHQKTYIRELLRRFVMADRKPATTPTSANDTQKSSFMDDTKIEIEIVYNMYRIRRFTPNTVCAGFCLSALPTMPYRKLTSQG
jgi:adenine C2-methylase RlmN of 23S rRNA A2503 and tRNA A37